jgi:hypothetical protein
MALGSMVKKQQQEFGTLLDAARRAVDALKDLVEVEVEDAETAKDKLLALRDAIADAEGACSDLASFCTSFYEEQQEAYDNRSEKWQEGDKGQAVSSWLDEWSTVSEPSSQSVDDSVDEYATFPTSLGEAFGFDDYELSDFIETVEGLSTEAEF